MRRSSGVSLAIVLLVLLVPWGPSSVYAAQRGGLSSMAPAMPAPAVYSGYGYGASYFPNGFSSFGYPGGYGFPSIGQLSLPPPYPYLPQGWWASPYPATDPRQAGYNPRSGYDPETVTTLLLSTYPEKAKISLDGIYVGRANYLGPIQLPIGEHTLRVEAAGFEPSETVLKVERAVLQQLEIRLSPSTHSAQLQSRP